MSLFTDPADLRANSYVSLDDANNILNDRPFTATWDNASQDSDGREYRVDGAVGSGQTTIALKDGKGNFNAGDRFVIDGDPTEYNIVSDVAAPASSVDVTPVLVNNIADNAAVHRLTSNVRESGLLWATRVLDVQMNWFGSKRNGPSLQTLRWPRAGIVDLDGYNVTQEAIPEILECVTAETALYLLDRDLASTPDLLGLGFSKASMPGPFSVVVDRLMKEKMIPDYLLNKMRYIGVLDETVGGQGARVVSLLRA